MCLFNRDKQKTGLLKQHIMLIFRFTILFLCYYWNKFTCFNAQKTQQYFHIVHCCSPVSIVAVNILF